MKWRRGITKYVVALVILLLMLNPETVHLPLFVDAVGVDMLLLLFEVQLLAIAAATFRHAIRPVIAFFLGFSMHPFIVPTWNDIKHNPDALAFLFPTGAILMFALLAVAPVYIVCNVV